MDMTGHDVLERIAALVLVIVGGIFTLRAIGDRRALLEPGALQSAREVGAAGDTSAVPSVRRSLVLIMAALSGGAAFIHFVAAPPHFAEIGDLAAGFVAAALFQAAWIRWCLAGPGRRTIAIGIVGNLAIIAAWAWTRTVGLPDATGVLVAEVIGYPDAASIVFEGLLVAILIACWFRVDVRIARSTVARTVASVALVPALSLVLVVTSLATLAILTGRDHGLLTGPPPMPGMDHVATP